MGGLSGPLIPGSLLGQRLSTELMRDSCRRGLPPMRADMKGRFRTGVDEDMFLRIGGQYLLSGDY